MTSGKRDEFHLWKVSNFTGGFSRFVLLFIYMLVGGLEPWNFMTLMLVGGLEPWNFMILMLVGGLEPWNFMTFHSVGNVIIPTAELIFFRGVGIPTTNQPYCWWIYPLKMVDLSIVM